MSRDSHIASPVTGYAATTKTHQAGTDAVNADRATLTRQYGELRRQLVIFHSAAEPDMVAIDHAIDGLAQLQLDIKATYGLIGNNPIEDRAA